MLECVCLRKREREREKFEKCYEESIKIAVSKVKEEERNLPTCLQQQTYFVKKY